MEKTKPILLETDNYLTIQSACSNAMMNKDMMAIIGPTGSGKTVSFTSFLEKHPNHVFLVSARKSMNARIFYSSIANTISDENYEPSIPLYFCIKKAANVFTEDSTNKLLIIDEAGKFSPTMLEYLHEFRDLTKETTGIILGGVEYFQSHMDSWVFKNRQGMPEVYSRINSWHHLNRPRYEEVVAMIQANGIDDSEFERSCRGIANFRLLDNRIKLYILTSKKKKI